MQYTVKNGVMMLAEDAKKIQAKADNVRAEKIKKQEKSAK